VFLLWLVLQPASPVVVLRCEVTGDAEGRVYELHQAGEGAQARWSLAMRSRKAGTAAVRLPLPDARPTVTDSEISLEYHTLNGGRDVRWMVRDGSATLDVHANFELEVNVEADLDPRVELMNTHGPITALACVRPARR
jgi:hypothetical protein